MRNNGAIKDALQDTFIQIVTATSKPPSARVLAKSAGVGLSSVYYHFRSLDDLAMHAVRRHAQRCMDRAAAEISQAAPTSLTGDVAVALACFAGDVTLTQWLASACTTPAGLSEHTSMLCAVSRGLFETLSRRHGLTLLGEAERAHVIGLLLSTTLLRNAANAQLGGRDVTAIVVAATLRALGSTPEPRRLEAAAA